MRDAGGGKKNRVGLIAIGGLFIFLMIFSGLAMWEPKDESNEFVYNNYLFLNTGNGWAATIDGKQLSFSYSPRELANISAGDVKFLGKRVYILHNPENESLNSFEMQRVGGFLTFKGYSMNEACSAAEGCGNLPVFNCTDTGGREAVYFESGGEDKIYNSDRCVVLQYKDSRGLGLVSELFVYKLLGVM